MPKLKFVLVHKNFAGTQEPWATWVAHCNHKSRLFRFFLQTWSTDTPFFPILLLIDIYNINMALKF